MGDAEPEVPYLIQNRNRDLNTTLQNSYNSSPYGFTRVAGPRAGVEGRR